MEQGQREAEVLEEIDVEWEEWDGSGSFIHHCIAGSIAGVSEHTLLYPMDTIKTHMQSYCAQCPVNINDSTNTKMNKMMNLRSNITTSSHHHQLGMWGTFRDLMGVNNSSSKTPLPTPTQHNNRILVTTSIESSSAATLSSPSINTTGFLRLWRGVQTIAIGCIPAHALYFSCYEATKHTLHSTTGNDTLASAVAGATATIGHDIIMAPLDTIKQRLQLGHYEGQFYGAVKNIYKHEGLLGLFRSFPITLFTNVPYGVIMVSTNDFLKDVLQQQQTTTGARHHEEHNAKYTLSTCLIAGSAAGCVASAVTTPLDRVKTRLQTQSLGIPQQALPDYCKITASSSCPKISSKTVQILKYNGIRDAFLSIVREEGWVGLFRGLTPRVLAHTPAVAISWTSYEMAKNWLAQL